MKWLHNSRWVSFFLFEKRMKNGFACGRIDMNWLDEGSVFYGRDWFLGMEKTHPERWELLFSAPSGAALACRRRPEGRVALIVSGGGSDGPWVPGFVGDGLADAAVIGAPYTAPNAYAIYQAAKALDQKRGVLLLYNNFMGDYLNNDMAAELLGLEGIAAEQVAFCDDMGSALGEPRENRSGRSGGALLIRIAAKVAREGKSLRETAALVRRAGERLATLSVTMDPRTGRAEFGKGFSHEPGFLIKENTTLRQTAADMIGMLLEDVRPRAGEKMALLVNRLRLTSYADGYVFAGHLYRELSARFPVLQMRVGAYNNILDLYGFTVSLLCADETVQPYLSGAVSADSFLL